MSSYPSHLLSRTFASLTNARAQTTQLGTNLRTGEDRKSSRRRVHEVPILQRHRGIDTRLAAASATSGSTVAAVEAYPHVIDPLAKLTPSQSVFETVTVWLAGLPASAQVIIPPSLAGKIATALHNVVSSPHALLLAYSDALAIASGTTLRPVGPNAPPLAHPLAAPTTQGPSTTDAACSPVPLESLTVLVGPLIAHLAAHNDAALVAAWVGALLEAAVAVTPSAWSGIAALARLGATAPLSVVLPCALARPVDHLRAAEAALSAVALSGAVATMTSNAILSPLGAAAAARTPYTDAVTRAPPPALPQWRVWAAAASTTFAAATISVADPMPSNPAYAAAVRSAAAAQYAAVGGGMAVPLSALRRAALVARAVAAGTARPPPSPPTADDEALWGVLGPPVSDHDSGALRREALRAAGVELALRVADVLFASSEAGPGVWAARGVSVDADGPIRFLIHGATEGDGLVPSSQGTTSLAALFSPHAATAAARHGGGAAGLKATAAPVAPPARAADGEDALAACLRILTLARAPRAAVATLARAVRYSVWAALNEGTLCAHSDGAPLFVRPRHFAAAAQAAAAARDVESAMRVLAMADRLSAWTAAAAAAHAVGAAESAVADAERALLEDEPTEGDAATPRDVSADDLGLDDAWADDVADADDVYPGNPAGDGVRGDEPAYVDEDDDDGATVDDLSDVGAMMQHAPSVPAASHKPQIAVSSTPPAHGPAGGASSGAVAATHHHVARESTSVAPTTDALTTPVTSDAPLPARPPLHWAADPAALVSAARPAVARAAAAVAALRVPGPFPRWRRLPYSRLVLPPSFGVAIADAVIGAAAHGGPAGEASSAVVARVARRAQLDACFEAVAAAVQQPSNGSAAAARGQSEAVDTAVRLIFAACQAHDDSAANRAKDPPATAGTPTMRDLAASPGDSLAPTDVVPHMPAARVAALFAAHGNPAAAMRWLARASVAPVALAASGPDVADSAGGTMSRLAHGLLVAAAWRSVLRALTRDVGQWRTTRGGLSTVLAAPSTPLDGLSGGATSVRDPDSVRLARRGLRVLLRTTGLDSGLDWAGTRGASGVPQQQTSDGIATVSAGHVGGRAGAWGDVATVTAAMRCAAVTGMSAVAVHLQQQSALAQSVHGYAICLLACHYALVDAIAAVGTLRSMAAVDAVAATLSSAAAVSARLRQAAFRGHLKATAEWGAVLRPVCWMAAAARRVMAAASEVAAPAALIDSAAGAPTPPPQSDEVAAAPATPTEWLSRHAESVIMAPAQQIVMACIDALCAAACTDPRVARPPPVAGARADAFASILRTPTDAPHDANAKAAAAGGDGVARTRPSPHITDPAAADAVVFTRAVLSWRSFADVALPTFSQAAARGDRSAAAGAPGEGLGGTADVSALLRFVPPDTSLRAAWMRMERGEADAVPPSLRAVAASLVRPRVEPRGLLAAVDAACHVALPAYALRVVALAAEAHPSDTPAAAGRYLDITGEPPVTRERVYGTVMRLATCVSAAIEGAAVCDAIDATMSSLPSGASHLRALTGRGLEQFGRGVGAVPVVGDASAATRAAASSFATAAAAVLMESLHVPPSAVGALSATAAPPAGPTAAPDGIGAPGARAIGGTDTSAADPMSAILAALARGAAPTASDMAAAVGAAQGTVADDEEDGHDDDDDEGLIPTDELRIAAGEEFDASGVLTPAGAVAGSARRGVAGVGVLHGTSPRFAPIDFLRRVPCRLLLVRPSVLRAMDRRGVGHEGDDRHDDAFPAVTEVDPYEGIIARRRGQAVVVDDPTLPSEVSDSELEVALAELDGLLDAVGDGGARAGASQQGDDADRDLYDLLLGEAGHAHEDGHLPY